MAGDFKFGAKLKLFGEHDIVIEPNPDHPFLIEYHDDAGIGVTRDFISQKLNITNDTIKRMIPENTAVTDFIVDRKSKRVEVGVKIEPGDDFVLNKYKDIFVIDEVSLFYEYDPQTGHSLNVEVDGDIDATAIQEKVVETAIDAINENTQVSSEGEEEELPTEDDMMEEDPMENEPMENEPMEDEELPMEDDELPEE